MRGAREYTKNQINKHEMWEIIHERKNLSSPNNFRFK